MTPMKKDLQTNLVLHSPQIANSSQGELSGRDKSTNDGCDMDTSSESFLHATSEDALRPEIKVVTSEYTRKNAMSLILVTLVQKHHPEAILANLPLL